MIIAEPIVTDHALIRWLERVNGWPMEAARRTLAQQVASVALAGASSHRTPDCIFVFDSGRLITVLPPTANINDPRNRERHEAARRPNTRIRP